MFPREYLTVISTRYSDHGIEESATTHLVEIMWPKCQGLAGRIDIEALRRSETGTVELDNKYWFNFYRTISIESDYI